MMAMQHHVKTPGWGIQLALAVLLSASQVAVYPAITRAAFNMICVSQFNMADCDGMASRDQSTKLERKAYP